MKKLILFTIYAICCYYIFTALLYFNEMPIVALWYKAHRFYLVSFILSDMAILFVLGYFYYKKWKAQTADEKTAATLKARSNAIRARKFFLWLLASTFMFGGCAFLLNFSEKYYFVWNSILVFCYGVVFILLFWAYQRKIGRASCRE